jgi:hypothetical protein
MRKRFWVCGIVVSIAAMLLDFLVHGLLLKGDYDALVAQGLMRSPEDAQHFMPYMAVAHLLIGYGLTWLYMHFNGMHSNGAHFNATRADRPANDASLATGLRFGAAVAVMSTIPGYLIYYAVQPLPAMLVHKQMIFSSIAMLLLGLLMAWLNPGRRTL